MTILSTLEGRKVKPFADFLPNFGLPRLVPPQLGVPRGREMFDQSECEKPISGVLACVATAKMLDGAGEENAA